MLNNNGFSLGEVLIVVAIIGIFASIILLSFGDVVDSRKRQAAEISAESLREESAVHFARNTHYATFCDRTKNKKLEKVVNDIKNELYDNGMIVPTFGGSFSITKITVGTTSEKLNCESTESGWTLRLKFPSGDNHYCVDDTNFSGSVSGAGWPTEFQGCKNKNP
ncbi:MAG: type II secretion system protein [Candidatus Campbellbacteria bacterium]|nr:type II secretion system protein [Candidatus Campbellbacteria bacterium]